MAKPQEPLAAGVQYAKTVLQALVVILVSPLVVLGLYSDLRRAV